MSAKHKASPPGTPENKPAASKPNPVLAVLVIASIAVVIAGILLLKDRQPPAETLSATQVSAPAGTAGDSAAAAGDSAATAGDSAAAAGDSADAAAGTVAVAGPVKPSLPADQLSKALANGQPALVFMHSTSCQSCIDMMKVVDLIYPEFAGQITLVDVDVYDEANGPLMKELGLRYIPTVVVFNSQGESAQNIGLMKPIAFRDLLLKSALGG